MKTLAALLAKTVLISTTAAGISACSPVNLSDLGIPNPFASNEDVPPAANPTTDASTYVGPSPSNISLVGSPGKTFEATNDGFAKNVAPYSDQRPMDPGAARAYDMIVQRGQATCAVPPLIIGFGRVQGGYSANVTCSSLTNSTAEFGTNTMGFNNTNSGFGGGFQ